MKMPSEVKLRKWYLNVHKHYRKIVPYDILNTNVVGSLTIFSFLISAFSLVCEIFFPALLVNPSNDGVQTVIEYIRWMCHIYSAYVVLLTALDRILSGIKLIRIGY